MPRARPMPLAGKTLAQSLRLAAIDVGSNSIHMIVAQVDADGGITTLWRMKEHVGLGRISFPSRRLSCEAMDRAIRALARFKQAAVQRQCERIVAVATSAIREAINGGDFILRARRELKLYIKLVSARDEARLIYLGVRHATPLRDQPNLIIDIGGGSVEFAVGDDRRAQLLESRKLGAARITSRFVRSDPISDSDLAAMLKHYDRELKPLCAQIESLAPVRVIGSSGTFENVAAMCGQLHTPNAEGLIGLVERKPLEKLVERLLKSDSIQRGHIRGLDDQRKDQIVASAVLIRELFARLKLKRIHVCGSALREGILVDYISRHLPDLAIRREVPDPRRRSVLDLARRCDWHKSHSEQVARLTLRLFDELAPLHKLGSVERELIEFAALLHDIGWHIAPKAHHKHSQYLIVNGELKSFTDEEVQIIGNIARYHRKSPPSRKHPSYRSLAPGARRTVDVGAALLRVADGLDRSHAGVVTDLTAAIDRERVRITVTARADAELEIWAAMRKVEWFQSVFDRSVSIQIARR